MQIDKRKRFYIIVDCESSLTRKAVDVAFAVTDKQGRVYASCAVLVNGVYGKDELFYNRDSGFFGLKNLEERKATYQDMIKDGRRMLASVRAINKWLLQAHETFRPTLTAYNLPFDEGVCKNTGIDLTIFERRFCLWKESARVFGSRKSYAQFLIDNGYFSAKLNGLTNAEVMAHYVTGSNDLEPHTALEDIVDFEIPILVSLLKQKKGFQHKPYNWREFKLSLLAVARQREAINAT